MKNFTKVLVFMVMFGLMLGVSFATEEGPDIRSLKKLTSNLSPDTDANSLSVGDFVWVKKDGPKKVEDTFTYKKYPRTIYYVKKIVRAYKAKKLIRAAREAKYSKELDAKLGNQIFTVVEEADVKLEDKVIPGGKIKGGFYLVQEKPEPGPVTKRWIYRKKK